MLAVTGVEVEKAAAARGAYLSDEKDNMQIEENGSGRGDLGAELKDSLFQNKPSKIPPLEEAEEFFEMGVNAVKSDQFEEALDFLGRALEIRVAHYGELAPECATAYLEYGRALFYRAIEEYIPLMYGDDEVKESLEDESSSSSEEEEEAVAEASNFHDSPSEAPTVSNITKSSKEALVIDDSRNQLTASALASADERKDTFDMEKKKAEGSEATATEDASSNSEGSGEDMSEGECDLETEEEDSDLDLAWKMLDIAQRIFEEDKKANNLKIADVATALGDVSLEREDLDSCLKDYTKALTILEGTVDPDSPHIASVCYKICLALDSMEKLAEALNYGRRAVKVLECRLHRVEKAVKCIEAESLIKTDSGVPATPKTLALTAPEQDLKKRDLYLTEMRIYGQLLIEFKDKIQELQQLIEEEEKEKEKESAQVSTLALKDVLDSSTPTRASTRSEVIVTDLGVAGRGIKHLSTPFRPPVRVRKVKRVCRDEEDLRVPVKKQCIKESCDKTEPPVLVT